MAIEFSCPRCDRRYSVADALAGRRVTCKACGQERTVPGQAVAPMASRPVPPPAPALAPSSKREAVYQDFDELEDDDADEAGLPPPKPSKFDDFASPSRPKPRRTGPRRRSAASDLNVAGPIGLFLGLLAVSFLTFVVLNVTDLVTTPQAAYYFGVILGVSCLGMVLAGEITMLMVAFTEGVTEGLLCFFPPYQVYYLFTRWDEAKRPFALTMTGILTIGSLFLIRTAITEVEWGPTADYKVAEAAFTEYAQAIEEMHICVAMPRNPRNAGEMDARFEAVRGRVNEIESRLKHLGRISKADWKKLRHRLGNRMRAAINSIIADTIFAEAFNPQVARVMPAIRDQLQRSLENWREEGESQGGGNGNPPALAQDGGNNNHAGAAPNHEPPKTGPEIPPGADATTRSLIEAKALELNVFKRLEAIQRLQRIRPDGHHAEVAEGLALIVKEDDQTLAKEAIKALASWHTPETVPVLIEALDESRVFVRFEAIKALGKIKDPRALEPLCARIREDSFQVKDALKEYGKAAEPAVIALLSNPVADVRREALDVLKDIGGMDTLIAMRDLPPDGDGIVRMMAQDTWKTLEARVGAPPAAAKKKKDDSPFVNKKKPK